MAEFDIDHIEALLQAAAAERDTLSYAGLLQSLGHGFTRPKMRALCVVLDAIDARAEAAGQPELAALVVRESDQLPGQGWWIGRSDYAGAWEGAPARKYLLVVQRRAFDYWQARGAPKDVL
ncbi:ribose-phosphate pyrophosphokinase [Polymorphobacter fuscus]|uniref:Ribose-phosphate pyrophosphokinase n=1 Tax=Sandarakinorhabdus fusca TaxID=1439888 RepID=A0A7C9GPL8_9SPHN|nr:ribose-phosphate pyrophosphokinase [Polymorphobacter fuscus]KAB7646397.1 ribose-phosphate pyrophosphokinase [Polymorphobacter fuscus]MQT17632.1 ribose-phosphate pyrophosphokinase [Polymorphobacter fuscus]NJC09824.1 hypothetical protein [Polymorphobacter fuscus]